MQTDYMAMDDKSEIHSNWSGGAEEEKEEEEEEEEDNNNNNNNNNPCFRKFMLYETRSNFYMVGWDKSRTIWRVLKIDRLEPSELNIIEDSTTYSEVECCDLLTRINDGNKSTGGLKFVTPCYGIVGFVKFLGPHYMLLITNRRKIGVICGHAVYAITKSKMIPVPNATVQSNVVYSKHENRYKKLLCSVDLTKNFFFSYSYHVMNNFQKNVSNQEAGQLIYENMFVWNEFMTRGIRSHLKSRLWTVALVYGFFKQVKLSTSGRDFKLTIIARRSRHYAGTRYLKRGVNEKGRVANDVETEQIVFEDVPEGGANQISSVVQNRGSIPLFWSQETSRLNIKPDIILSKDQNYEATRLHFQNLVKRYGNPIIILNLIKTHEKKPRESILHTEFCKVIDLINTELSEENCLKFLHWDLNKFSKNKNTNVLELLIKIADFALNFTGFFCGQVTSNIMNVSVFESSDGDDFGQQTEDSVDLKVEACNSMRDANENLLHNLTFQKGVLRTNCVDCLDRTNVAQYAYGLVALGHQLHALGLTNTSAMDLDSPLAENLMSMYEMMGDMLALQYGGSAAHNKIFSRRRGQWEAATQSQEFLRIIHRYYSNAYMDAEKQDAINLFLGHFQPHHGKPELWELDSDQHHNVGIGDSNLSDENLGSCFKRSLSDGNILCERNSPIQNRYVDKRERFNQMLKNKIKDGNRLLSESNQKSCLVTSFVGWTMEAVFYCRTRRRMHPATADKQLFPGMHAEQCQVGVTGHWDCFNCSNFLEPDWHSSSGTSCGEETYERSSLISNPSAEKSCDFVANEVKVDASESESGCRPKVNGDLDTFQHSSSSSSRSSSDRVAEFPDKFVQWVEKCCSFDFRD